MSPVSPGIHHEGQATAVYEALTYRGEALRAVALPLGGIGTGSVALAGDGGLRQWQIVNNVNHDGHVPDSFFAIWAGTRQDAGRNAVAHHRAGAVLQSDALYEDSGFRPAPSVSDHLIPEPSRRLLADLPGVDGLAITTQYPIVEVAYEARAIPVQVRLEAFSPFIPLNSKDSGLPAILFNFTVTNPHDHALSVSLMATQQNLVGWDGKTQIDGVHNPGYGGNVNGLAHLRDVAALDMTNVRLEASHPANGRLALAALRQPGDEISTMLQWKSPRQVWDHFASQFGQLPDRGSGGASPSGRTWNGALAVRFELAPGASRTVTFVLAWHFPNRYVDWDQRSLGIRDVKSRFWIGNQYNNWFDSALAVVEYVRDHLDRLVAQTQLYRDRFFESTLPWELLESVAGPVSTIRTPTCLWNEDGRFHGFEGCHGASTRHGALEGCCPLNCTHVWNYEMALARLFPDLERRMRRTDLIDQMSPEGAIPHRTPLPLNLARPWNEFIGGPRNPAMDGELGTVLKTYREVRHGAGQAWFDEMWPRVKRLMQHVMDDYDTEGDGVIRGEQPNTYDISIYGPNTFIGSLYLAALRAAEEMARLQGEDNLARRYRERFELGRQRYDELCWNGEYYSQVVDLERHPEQQFGSGCHVDQLLGQWWAHVLGLGYVLPEEHVKTAVQNIFQFNRREGFSKADQRPRVYMDERDRGLYICTWPHGGKPEVPTQYSDEVWSGLEYPVACLLLFEDQIEPALTMLADVRERHDGTRRSPWNEVECGDHYVRPMASWTLLEAAAGYQYDATRGSLAFAPRIDPGDFCSFFITGSSWGTFSQGGGCARLGVDYGELGLKELRLKSDRADATVHLNEQEVAAGVEQIDGCVRLRFAQPVTVAAGEELVVAFG
ncbi:MAG TPA: GH116 family glycosyl-hydrolase [Anaerolineae bacterium]|nr:GH116 family glycosyl-hydrolase [Anaerolineae bacterium]